MKTRKTWTGIIAFIAIIGFTMTACPEAGPAGKDAQVKIVDAQGKEIGVSITGGNIVNNGKYSFAIYMDTGKIVSYNVYATLGGGTGRFYNNSTNAVYYPNYLYKTSQGDEYFMARTKDAQGYVPGTAINQSLQPYASRITTGGWYDSTGNISSAIELERISDISSDSDIIGFTPETPLRYVW